MTLRKQFTLLIFFIIGIPFTSIIYLETYNYFKSSNRMLVEGYQDIRKLEKIDLSEEDIENLIYTLKIMPPDVQTSVFTSDFKLIYSNIENHTKHSDKTRDEMWDYIQRTSDKYFYQLTSIPTTDNSKIYIATRIPRNHKDNMRKENMLHIFLIAALCICIVLVIAIFKTIFNSVLLIEANTNAIVEGDLNKKIEVDTSKRKNEITSITDSLEKMRISLLEAQNRKSKLIMGISHDLRTPVAVIKGYTEAMMDGVITSEEDQKNTLEIINAKTNQLETMINSLINFVKLESSDWRENITQQNMTKFIQEYTKEAKITGNVFKRRVETEILLSEEVIIKFDKDLMSRALENLVGNAIRYTNDGDTITIKAWETENNMYISVSDTGIGMDENDLKHIFDLFYRGTNSRREEGLGIGLSVVHSIVTTHGWKIDVQSEKNKGTTFIITMNKENGN